MTDLTNAAEQVAEKILRDAGERHYLHSRVFDDLVEMAKERLRAQLLPGAQEIALSAPA